MLRSAHLQRPLLLRCAVAATHLALAGCVSIPDIYRPPIERKTVLDGPVHRLRESVKMNDADFATHAIGDVSPALEQGDWRWTGQNPSFRFRVDDTKGWKLVCDFVTPGAVLKAVGPLTVTWRVNGHALATERYDTDGQKRLERPVPDDWLWRSEVNIVRIELDKVYVAGDGARLGLILVQIGFAR